VSKLRRLLCYESQHQSQSNEKSLVQFDYEKAVSNYLGTQSAFNPDSFMSMLSVIIYFSSLFREARVMVTTDAALRSFDDSVTLPNMYIIYMYIYIDNP